MEEPEPASPWALQLAARVEKLSPPTTAAVCAAAALATIALLDDERAQPDGIWHTSVQTWNGEKIRKIVRRARASAWERAQSVGGVTVRHDGAEVRAFVPSPMDQAPREVTKLQIQSTALDEAAPISALPDLAPSTLVVAITPHFAMSWGKQAAQSAHAGQRAWMLADPTVQAAWDQAERPLVVLHPDAALWDALDDVATTRIHDGGFTEIPPGTNSSIAWFTL
ncbi:MAG: peptidyl-tRNA hydrolase [Acidimicrobiales bacterium]|jgi:peptidyl-tRNA hydrolase